MPADRDYEENSEILNNNNEERTSRQPGRRRYIDFSFGLTNARSLWQKVDSLSDYFLELDLSLAIVTETWLHRGEQLDRFASDCHDRLGLELVYRNRAKTGSSNPGGGVAIVHKPSRIKIVQYPITNKGHEILCVKGRLPNNTRPIFIFAVYVPPKIKSDKCKELMECISEAVLKIKTLSRNPYIVIGGDFNRRGLDDAIGDYADLRILQTDATRLSPTLDVCVTNFGDELVALHNHPPLETSDGLSCSDHNFFTFRHRLQHWHQFEWIWYKSRIITNETEEAFKADFQRIVWDHNDLSNEERAVDLHRKLFDLAEKYFPLTWKKKRSTDDPWIDDETRPTSKYEKSFSRGRAGRLTGSG